MDGSTEDDVHFYYLIVETFSFLEYTKEIETTRLRFKTLLGYIYYIIQ